jgi:hypothetical protein
VHRDFGRASPCVVVVAPFSNKKIDAANFEAILFTDDFGQSSLVRSDGH